MNCPNCKAKLGHLNASGEPMLRNAGMVFKADAPVMVCPRCKSDVPFTRELAKALSDRLVLFLRPK
jgi:uncharacterized protein YbaR (Trm112 family)